MNIKRYGLEYIFSDPLKRIKIESRLEKGYCRRRDVTDLIDNMRKGGKLTLEQGETGLIFKIDGNLPETINSTPFWLRTISLWIFGDPELKEKFKEIRKTFDQFNQDIEAKAKQDLLNSLALANSEEERLEDLVKENIRRRVNLKLAETHLIAFNQEVQKNLFGSWNWSSEEIKTATTLENTIFGNFSDRLLTDDGREFALDFLKNEISYMEEELLPLKNCLLVNQAKIESLKAAIPPQEEEKEEIKDFNFMVNNPFLSAKLFWTSISNSDDFYQNSVCPALKSLSFMVTSDKKTAATLYSKWETKLKLLAKTWQESGSSDENIDDIIPKDQFSLFKILQSANTALTLLSRLPVSTLEFFQHLSSLDIPDDFEKLEISDRDAKTLLDQYLENPKTDLSPLFQSGSLFQTWPRDCQFFLGMLFLQMKDKLIESESNPAENLAMLNKALNFSLPPFAVWVMQAAVKSEWVFDLAIGNMSSFIPTPRPDTEKLETYRKIFFIPEDQKHAFEKAIDFSKTEPRMKFDTQYRSFLSSIFDDLTEAIYAKHTKKEFNLQALTLCGMGQMDTQMKAFKATRDFLENPKEQTTREAAIKATASSLLGTFKLLKTISALPQQNQNMQDILQTFDQSVLPILRTLEPLDLTKESFQDRLQNVILSPMNQLA